MNFLVLEGDFPFWRGFVVEQWKRAGARTLLLSQATSLWRPRDYDRIEALPLAGGQLDRPALERQVAAFGGVRGALSLFEPAIGRLLEVQRALGLPELSRGEPRTLRHKAAMVEVARRAGLAVPETVYGREARPLVAQALAQLRLPVIVKPPELAGKAGVRLVHEAGDLLAAVEAAIAETLPFEIDGQPTSVVAIFGCERGALVQEYIDGPEYSIEGYASTGRPVVLAVTEKLHSGPPLFEELGHLQPARLGAADERAVRDYAAAICRAFALDNTWFHLEVRLRSSGPVLMELNCRLGGDMIGRLLELRSDLNVGASLLQVAGGGWTPPPPAWHGAAGVRMAVTDRGGRIGRIVPPVLRPDHEWAVFEPGPGEPVHPPKPGGVSRIGYYLVAADTADQVEQRLGELVAGTRVEWADEAAGAAP